MASHGPTAPWELPATETPTKAILLSVLVAIFFSGSPIYLSTLSRVLTWFVWVAIIWIIYKFSKEVSLWQLINPAIPYLIWLTFYLSWAVIVAPNTNLGLAGKLLFTNIIFIVSASILVSKPRYLQVFANAAQIALLANLVFWILIQWSSKVAMVYIKVSRLTDEDFLTNTRFGGMFANANHLGYICLVATILSILAVPWVAWIGRLSCIPLLYLAASRKAAALYVTILVLYVLIVQLRNIKFWLVMLTVCFSAVMVLGDGLRARSHSVARDPTLSRILDLREKETDQKGGMTRASLLRNWMAAMRDAPWYGYGFQAMVGTVRDEDDPEKILLKGPYPTGAHNTYLGVWAETGPIGLVALLLMLAYYTKRCLSSGGDSISKWVLVSTTWTTLMLLAFSHAYLFCFEGKIAFAFFCLLPSSVGLQQLGQWKVKST